MKDNHFTILCWFLPNSSMNQPHVTCVPSLLSLPPPPTPSLPSRLSQSPSLGSLSIYRKSPWFSNVHMVMCMFPCHSLPSSPLSFPLCVHTSVLCVCLIGCSANGFISTIFLESIYMHYYAIFGFLFLTLLCITGSLSASLESVVIFITDFFLGRGQSFGILFLFFMLLCLFQILCHRRELLVG